MLRTQARKSNCVGDSQLGRLCTKRWQKRAFTDDYES
jgi:hypothetical protein